MPTIEQHIDEVLTWWVDGDAWKEHVSLGIREMLHAQWREGDIMPEEDEEQLVNGTVAMVSVVTRFAGNQDNLLHTVEIHQQVRDLLSQPDESGATRNIQSVFDHLLFSLAVMMAQEYLVQTPDAAADIALTDTEDGTDILRRFGTALLEKLVQIQEDAAQQPE